MASDPICGDGADADEVAPHGHFSGDNDGSEDIVHLLILGSRRARTACGEDPDDSSDGASTDEGSVTCPKCRAVMPTESRG